jgi:hypothetical protein
MIAQIFLSEVQALYVSVWSFQLAASIGPHPFGFKSQSVPM